MSMITVVFVGAPDALVRVFVPWTDSDWELTLSTIASQRVLTAGRVNKL